MRRILVVLLTVALLGCARQETPQNLIPRDYAERLSTVHRKVAILVADQHAGQPSGLASVDVAAEVNRYSDYWLQFGSLRLYLIEASAPLDCRELRERHIEMLEHYQRECEYHQAYVITQNEDYRVKALDAQRQADRIYRLLRDQLCAAYPDLFTMMATDL